jgi:hypothetical protein
MANVSPIQAFTLVADAAYLSKRPLPTAPDGYYDWQVTGGPTDKREGHSTITNLVNRVSGFSVLRGASFDHSP